MRTEGFFETFFEVNKLNSKKNRWKCRLKDETNWWNSNVREFQNIFWNTFNSLESRLSIRSENFAEIRLGFQEPNILILWPQYVQGKPDRIVTVKYPRFYVQNLRTLVLIKNWPWFYQIQNISQLWQFTFAIEWLSTKQSKIKSQFKLFIKSLKQVFMMSLDKKNSGLWINQQWTDRAFQPNRLQITLFDALIFSLQWSNRIGYRCLIIKRFWTELIWLARTKQILFCSNIAFVFPLVTRSKVSLGDGSFSVDIFVDILVDISWVDIAWIVVMKNWVNAMIFILILADWILIRMKCINLAYKRL